VNWNGDKNKIILVGLVLVFLIAYLAVLFLHPENDKALTFLTGTIGALLLTLGRDMKSEPSAPPPGTTTKSASSVEQKTETPATPPPVPPAA
jgi:hypothetical protein